MTPRTLAQRRPIARTGIEVPVMGLGGAALGGLYQAVDDQTAAETIAGGLEAGLLYVDTAPFYGYGLSEHRFGEALRRFGRDRVVLSTKAGRRLVRRTEPQAPEDYWKAPLPFQPVVDYSHDGVMRSVEDSLQRLGTDRIDILYLHDVGRTSYGDDHPRLMAEAMSGGARAMRRLKEEGVVGAIGLGVNEWEVCAEALEHQDWDVFLLAGRYTLLEQTVLDGFFPLCERRGVSIIIGGPYNSGILAGGDTFNYDRAPEDVRDRAARLGEACRDHGVSLPAAALQFVLKHPVVASVIPGARSRAEMEQNIEHLTRPIPDDLWADLKRRGLLHPDAPS
ncbi:aldo/keto reductase [Inquilinus sp. CAU 1745]|uniref:aldo/keto reductase n=1 Tax=Inquilinus sp. CAU 1745 TaxID=3140369 RepID=UPI00325A4E30